MSDRVQIGGGVLSNRGLEAAMKAHRDSVSPTNRQMIAEAIVAYQRNAIDLTSEGEAAECIACEGSPKAPNIPCAICGRSPAPHPAPAELEVVATAVHPGSFGRWEVRPEEGATIASGDKFVRLTDAHAAIAAKDEGIERLKDLLGDPSGTIAHADVIVARAEAAEARVAEMENALTPFAALGCEMRDQTKPDEWGAWGYNNSVLTYGDFRRARAALHPEKEGE